jgi:hypothetical protein
LMSVRTATGPMVAGRERWIVCNPIAGQHAYHA